MMMIPRRNDFDLFDDMFSNPFFTGSESRVMKTDIKEKKDKYVIDMDLPGYEKEDIKIEIQDGYLTVKMLKQIKQKQTKKKVSMYVKKDIMVNVLEAFTLEVGNEEDIKAKFKNGTFNTRSK